MVLEIAGNPVAAAWSGDRKRTFWPVALKSKSPVAGLNVSLLVGPDALTVSEAPASVAKFENALPVILNTCVPSGSVVICWYSLLTGKETCAGS